MFSMKYTSPKVTPKQAGPSSAASLDSATSSLADVTAASAAAYDGNWGSERSRDSHYLSNGFTRKGEAARHGKHPRAKNNGSSAELKDSIMTSSNHDSTTSAMSENDSAVANVSEDIEPRSNLLALLDRDYLKGGEGSAISGEMHQRDKKSTHDAVDFTTEQDCTEGVTSEDANEKLEEDIKCDTNIGIQGTAGMQSIDTDGLSLHESAGDCLEYRRSVSMEPMFDNASPEKENTPTLETRSVGEGPGEVDPADEKSGSSAEEETSDSSAKSPRTTKETNPSSPIIYDVTEAQPASPIMSDVNTGNRFGEELTTPSEANTSEIGGDTYFDEQPPLPRLDLCKKPLRSGCSFEDDMVHVTLPPRVNRTTSSGYANKDVTPPFLPDCPSTPVQLEPGTSPFSPKQSHHQVGILSPRQPFSHTHSLLDDCSDEEETMFTIVDSPTRHVNSYSCLPRPRSSSEGSSPFHSYFKKNKQKQQSSRHSRHNSRDSTGSTAMQVASNNIQQALLQTRHRRWDCQSALCGPHAQSKEIFDLSNRVHYIPGYRPDFGDASQQLVARLSVSVEAIRAAMLASGLWRTVRLVRLPKGLFYPHQMDVNAENSEVWSLLKMLHNTLPILDQIDFGGYFIRASKGPDDIGSMSDDWRNEMLACVMECLPNIVAIDGFVVEKEVFEAETRNSEKAQSRSEEENQQPDDATYNVNRSQYDVQEKPISEEADENISDYGDCGGNCQTVPLCGLSDLVNTQSDNRQLNGNASCSATSDTGDYPDGVVHNSSVVMTKHLEDSSHIHAPGRFEMTEGVSSDAFDPVDRCASSNVQEENETIQECSSHESIGDGMKKAPTLSPSSSILSSSRSWGSNSSGNRPPPCPHSASRQRPVRLPSKPVDRKKGKGSFMKAGNGLKRRVLGLIPSVSMMDELDDEEDSDDSENAVETDCPTDLL